MRMRTVLATLILAAGGGLGQGLADSPNRPDFVANLTPGATVPFAGARAHGRVWFYLDESLSWVRYEIKLNSLDIAGVDGPGRTRRDTVTAVHFHIAPPGLAGPHVLNVFGPPSQDDAQMNCNPLARTIGGIWDDGDANASLPQALQSHGLTEMLDALCDGLLYVDVHTTRYPQGALRGQVMPQPHACD